MSRLRLGMVGGGQGAFIGAVHRIASRLDGHYDLVAGALSSDPARAAASAAGLGIAPDRSYPSFADMARAEAGRLDAVAVVTPNHLHHVAASAFLNAGVNVICDKPVCHTLADAEDLQRRVVPGGPLFALTHNYTGYPMVRHARALVAAGELGALRVVQAEYAQEWLATGLESTGQKQAEWRTDPARSGAGGGVGDIGTHAFNLVEFVTGQPVESLAADLSTFVPGRRLDDNAHMMLRLADGARGMLWSSQVAIGQENALRLRIYGEHGAIEWAQEQPNDLRVTRLGQPPALVRRGGPGAGPAAAHATRLPGGHPEGYLEAFAQLYTDFAEQIRARAEKRDPDPACLLVPGIAEGVRGMRFIDAAVRSGGSWTTL